MICLARLPDGVRSTHRLLAGMCIVLAGGCGDVPADGGIAASDAHNGDATTASTEDLPGYQLFRGLRRVDSESVSQELARSDPAVDGWETEVFVSAAERTLAILTSALERRSGFPDDAFHEPARIAPPAATGQRYSDGPI